VIVELTVENVDFALLSNDASLLTSFKGKCAETIAAGAGEGISASDVVVTVTAASVKVTAEITPPSGTTAASVETTLGSASTLSANLVTNLNTISTLGTVKTGDLAVTGLTVTKNDPSSLNTTDTTAASGGASASDAMATCTAKMSGVIIMLGAMYSALSA
jgi:hypothetical protein